MMEPHVDILNPPITRIKIAESGKGMGMITSTKGINTLPHEVVMLQTYRATAG